MDDLPGSSPLARGLRLHRVRRGLRPGIIPARAGFTRRPVGEPGRRPDHPRSRGVYLGGAAPEAVKAGSSPLARGLQAYGRVNGSGPRIIPARAGFTLGCGRRSPPRSDHPRSRGVYPWPGCASAWPTGSSPLARGLRALAGPGRAPSRIIPARAGFTRPLTGPAVASRDHPRSRGVYSGWRGLSFAPRGSSPLARGLHRPRHHHHRRRRIIPARAGFTEPRPACAPGRQDHPRSRGVYATISAAVMVVIGSSPLARGLHPGTVQGPCGRRIIPARAGFTAGGAAGGLRGTDHPRSRGVYSCAVAHAIGCGGSSPLARGLPPAGLPRPLTARIIPARAGFTAPS